MITLPEKLPFDDLQPALEYVFELATLIEPFHHYDEDTGEVFFWGSQLVGRYISRYNRSATESELKKLNMLKARLDEFERNDDLQKGLVNLELDVEKFWHLLLFVYDFSYNQCSNGIKFTNTLTTLQTIFEKIAENTEKRSFYSQTFKEEVTITVQIGKKKYTIADCPTIIRICSKLKKDIDTSENDEWYWETFPKSTVSESTSVLAYAFYSHFISFFNTQKAITSSRRNKDSPSIKEKSFIANLIYFTEIILNESISTDPDYLKTLIKRYKDDQLPNGAITY